MRLEDILLVKEFPNVFLDNLLRTPSDREIVFEINLVSSMGPMLKALYQMALAKLRELKVQPQELLDKKQI